MCKDGPLVVRAKLQQSGAQQGAEAETIHCYQWRTAELWTGYCQTTEETLTRDEILFFRLIWNSGFF